MCNQPLSLRSIAARAFAGTLLAILAAGSPANAQPPSFPEDRSRDPETRSGREGGIPRAAIAPERDRDRRDGQEEGVPEFDTRPGTREFQPRWIPPRDDWRLGVWGYNTDAGLVITRVAPGSAAANRGLEPGDRIVSVGGYQVGYVGDLLYPLGYELQRQAGRRGDVLLLVQNVRNRELVNLDVRLDRPDRPRPFPAPRPTRPSFGVEPRDSDNGR